MKTILLTLMLTASAFAREGAGGHGGDPFDILAKPFPEQRKLETALSLVEEKIVSSKYEQAFKDSLLKELKTLKKDQKFQYIEDMALIPSGNADGDDLPSDLPRFENLGVMTFHEMGSPLYFNERVLQLSSEELAKLITRGLIQHVTEPTLSRDDTYTSDLTSSVFAGAFDQKLVLGIKYGINLKENLDAGELFDALVSTMGVKDEASKLRLASYKKDLLIELDYNNQAISEMKVSEALKQYARAIGLVFPYKKDDFYTKTLEGFQKILSEIPEAQGKSFGEETTLKEVLR